MQVSIRTTLSCSPTALVDLPVAAWKDIKEWYVKWDTFHFTCDGERWQEVDLNNDSEGAAGWKNPIAITVVDPATGETLHDDDE